MNVYAQGLTMPTPRLQSIHTSDVNYADAGLSPRFSDRHMGTGMGARRGRSMSYADGPASGGMGMAVGRREQLPYDPLDLHTHVPAYTPRHSPQAQAEGSADPMDEFKVFKRPIICFCFCPPKRPRQPFQKAAEKFVKISEILHFG